MVVVVSAQMDRERITAMKSLFQHSFHKQYKHAL